MIKLKSLITETLDKSMETKLLKLMEKITGIKPGGYGPDKLKVNYYNWKDGSGSVVIIARESEYGSYVIFEFASRSNKWIGLVRGGYGSSSTATFSGEWKKSFTPKTKAKNMSDLDIEDVIKALKGQSGTIKSILKKAEDFRNKEAKRQKDFYKTHKPD
tara:strand:- start:118 stop:594 length:477 start_codon:yes stop_codon:yes gene_type:complete